MQKIVVKLPAMKKLLHLVSFKCPAIHVKIIGKKFHMLLKIRSNYFIRKKTEHAHDLIVEHFDAITKYLRCLMICDE